MQHDLGNRFARVNDDWEDDIKPEPPAAAQKFVDKNNNNVEKEGDAPGGKKFWITIFAYF